LSAASGIFPDLSEIFRYELCKNPAALFEPSGMMRQAQKANLADTIWNLGDCSAADVVIQHNTRHVIDGGSLIQRIPWNKGATFGQICQMYLDYLTKRYAHPVVVFDGHSCLISLLQRKFSFLLLNGVFFLNSIFVPSMPLVLLLCV
jgi:hypothetical protein